MDIRIIRLAVIVAGIALALKHDSTHRPAPDRNAAPVHSVSGTARGG